MKMTLKRASKLHESQTHHRRLKQPICKSYIDVLFLRRPVGLCTPLKFPHVRKLKC